MRYGMKTNNFGSWKIAAGVVFVVCRVNEYRRQNRVETSSRNEDNFHF